jgi:hypothetical protein
LVNKYNFRIINTIADEDIYTPIFRSDPGTSEQYNLLSSYAKDDKDKLNNNLIKIDSIIQQKTKTELLFKKLMSTIIDPE